MPSPALRHVGDKRAVVAMLLRTCSNCDQVETRISKLDTQNAQEEEAEHEPVTVQQPSQNAKDYSATPDDLSIPPGDYEMFFILRADNSRDRWSGQVGFPGGRQEHGETDEATVAREVWEEVGLVLPGLLVGNNKTTNWKRVGRVHDRVIVQGPTRLVIACIVFLCDSNNEIKLVVSPKEVAACGWVPVHYLISKECASHLRLSISNSLFGLQYPNLAEAARRIGLDYLMFTKVDLPISPMYLPDPSFGAVQVKDQVDTLKRFYLWGLTLGIVNDALHDQLGWRSNRIAITRGEFFGQEIEAIFSNQMHNVGIHIMRRVINGVLGLEWTWFDFVKVYIIFVLSSLFGSAVSIPIWWWRRPGEGSGVMQNRL